MHSETKKLTRKTHPI